jgi:hypothetical protein
MADLKKRTLTLMDPFADPRLFQGGPGGREATIEGGIITACNTRFRLLDGEEPIPEGSALKVMVGRTSFYCLVKADVEAYEAELAAGREKEAAERLRSAQQRAEDARAFNDALGLPFQWMPGHRVVLSGLSAQSWGNGQNRATVIHVMLTEDFESGRLKRKAGQFLCSTHIDAYGSDQGMREADGSKVTCKVCLAKAAIYGKTPPHEKSSTLSQAS